MLRIRPITSLLALALAAPGLEGAPHLERLEVEITPSDAARQFDAVADLTFAAGGESAVPLTLLVRPPLSVVDLRLGDGSAVVLDRQRAPALAATVTLPAADGDGRSQLRLHLRVEGAWQEGAKESRLEIPIPVPAWPPPRTGGEVFSATIEIPSEGQLVRAFPTSMTASAGGPGHQHRAFAVTLPVPPAFISLTVAAPGGAGLTIERVIDVAAATLLLVLLGWSSHRLRRTFR